LNRAQGLTRRDNCNSSAAAHGIADVNRVRRCKVFQLQYSFGGCGLGFQQMPPINPRQQSAGNRRRNPSASPLDEHITDGALGHFAAFIQEKNFIIALPESLLVLLVVQLAAGRLMP
jgi:hypothetical protein